MAMMKNSERKGERAIFHTKNQVSMYIVYVLRPNYWNGEYFNVYSLPAFSSIVDFGFLFFKEKEEEVQIDCSGN